MAKIKLTYEKAYAELQGIIERLQSDEIGLDNLAKEVKRAGELVQYCKDKLRGIEKDIADSLN